MTAWSRSGAPCTTPLMPAADAVTEDPALNYSGYADSFNPGDVHVPHTVDEWADFTVQGG